MNDANKQGCCRRDFIRNTALGAGALAITGVLPNVFGEENREKPDPAKREAAGKTSNRDGRAFVQIPDVRIRMSHRDAFLAGVSPTEVIEIELKDVLKLHGYCAGGVVLAFREAQEAFRVLYGDKLPVRQGMKVETAYHCCQAGVLAYVTGARTNFGALISRGDLALIPEETKKVVFTDKRSGKSVTILPQVDPHALFTPLFKKVREDSGIAPQVRKLLNDTVRDYIASPWQKLFEIREA